ncbi:MAG TPA: fatty acid desaturase family protein [Devosia sp.]|nr:fatty acid desaturase family protein [Devosia sp.]
MGKRDYSLTGVDTAAAVANGLAAAEWYHTDVPRQQMKELMQRSDGPALRDTALWVLAFVVTAAGGIWLWGSWWCVPFWLAYGVLYGSSTDSRWHECGHGTAFKTPWMNRAIYQIACFMVMRNPTVWRWSHARHHADTIIVGRDAEIAVMRPPDLLRVLLAFIGVVDAWTALSDMVRYSFGRLNAGEESFIPAMERPRVFFVARVWVVIYLAVIALALLTRSWIPIVMVGTPRLYGAWHMVMCGVLQHGGLADNVTDHRLNSRTVYMNPISRFIYWNMNYHVEHHMFPMIPYHALPRLHALIKHDLPPPNRSILDGYREMVPAFLRQLRYEDYYLRRELPPTAKPYRDELHRLDVAGGVARPAE